MKKRWLALGAVAVLGAGGYWGFQENKYRLPGLIQDWRDVLPAEDARKYEAKAVAELGEACAAWLKTGARTN